MKISIAGLDKAEVLRVNTMAQIIQERQRRNAVKAHAGGKQG